MSESKTCNSPVVASCFRNGSVLKTLRGFDEQFFYHFEEVDLCRRSWEAGYPLVYTPEAVITHLGGQSVNRFPIRFELERYRSRYRYFSKHFPVRKVRASAAEQFWRASGSASSAVAF